MEANNIPDAYNEVWWKIDTPPHTYEDTRNGTVIAYQRPFMMTIRNPTERVLFDRKRDCNHFFHIAEVVWMFAGSNDVRFIEYYNSRMRDFAEEDGIIHGAYGHRWLHHFFTDQIQKAINALNHDPTTRRSVIAMWDAESDLSVEPKDIPCNTHIYFRVVRGKLDMTVCNRSNDLIWGMLGANAVHMTYLHELIALSTDIPIGHYHVMTNNLHVYEHHWDLKPHAKLDYYANLPHDKIDALIKPFPLLQPGETWADLHQDCKNFMEGAYCKTQWMQGVVAPLLEAYEQRKLGDGNGLDIIEHCRATDWRLACEMYVENKDAQTV